MDPEENREEVGKIQPKLKNMVVSEYFHLAYNTKRITWPL